MVQGSLARPADRVFERKVSAGIRVTLIWPSANCRCRASGTRAAISLRRLPDAKAGRNMVFLVRSRSVALEMGSCGKVASARRTFGKSQRKKTPSDGPLNAESTEKVSYSVILH